MREEDVFHEALARDPADRAAYLDRACPDPAARASVEALLRANVGASRFLVNPAAEDTVPLPGCPEAPGTVIGPYKLLERIGEGGFGAVFVAEQTHPVQRKVAVKVLKPGMDTRQVVARFEAERQALAIMDHPNIARVFDGGQTSAGRPYFVMELVKGVPITDHCDRNQLPLPERLELFAGVCAAVQHAHQKGIVHRDLKPSNVLVSRHDTTAVVKVIDFGVAKALGQELTNKTLHTGVAQMIGTPLYMSPEQAGMSDLDVDTRSDVYSLGVLLYELLTGTTPFEKERFKAAGYDEIRRIIREEEPPRPSTRLSTLAQTGSTVAEARGSDPRKLSRLFRGELDWVVMKALEKDRNRRYETAAAFAADVGRYLADEPVLACPPSAAYRMRKFARRNKGGLAVAAAIGLGLVLGIGGIGWAARERVAQRQETIRHELERQARVTEQVNRVLADVDRLKREQKWQEAFVLARRTGAALVGSEVDDDTRKGVGDLLKELDFVARLDRIREDLVANVMNDLDSKTNYRRTADEYARTFREFGWDVETMSAEEAVARVNERPALARPLAAALDEWDSARRFGFGDPDQLSEKVAAIAREIDSDSLLRRVYNCRARSLTPEARVGEYRRLAATVDIRKETPRALSLLAQELSRAAAGDAAVEVLRAARFAHPSDFWLNVTLAAQLNQRGDPEAGRYYTAAVSLRPDSLWAHHIFGLWLNKHGTPTEHAECYRRMLELDPNSPIGHNGMGMAWWRLKRYDAAAASFRRANEVDPKHSMGDAPLGALLLELNKPAEAIPHLTRGVATSTQNSRMYDSLARALEQTGQIKEAMEVRREGVRRNPTDARYPNAYEYLARALERDGQIDEALATRREAVRQTPSAGAHRALAMMLGAAGQWDKAAAEYDRAVELDPADAHGRYMAAVAHAGAGSFVDYRRVCRAMVARYQATDPPQDAERTVIACLLLPDKLDADDLQQVQRLAERAVSGGEKSGHFRFGARAKGLADYRAGLHAEAVRWLKRYAPNGTGLHQDVITYAALAMAYRHLGKIEEARSALSQAKAILSNRPDPKKDRPFVPGQSHGWLYAEMLYREAEALVLEQEQS